MGDSIIVLSLKQMLLIHFHLQMGLAIKACCAETISSSIIYQNLETVHKCLD